MRVGTWNLAGRWNQAQRALMEDQDCDVWLLTEVPDVTNLDGYSIHLTGELMAPGRRWAAILSRGELIGRPDPHPASAAADAFGLTWCSSILPWRACGTTPWGEGNTAQKTIRAIDQIINGLPSTGLVWGGDWNHALTGPEYVGSLAGRAAIEDAARRLNLTVATWESPHREPGLSAIDHIAVPAHIAVSGACRIVAVDTRGRRLSDHDAYTTNIRIP